MNILEMYGEINTGPIKNATSANGCAASNIPRLRSGEYFVRPMTQDIEAVLPAEITSIIEVEAELAASEITRALAMRSTDMPTARLHLVRIEALPADPQVYQRMAHRIVEYARAANPSAEIWAEQVLSLPEDVDPALRQPDEWHQVAYTCS